MKVYLATPCNQLQAHAASEMPVLVSFAQFRPWMEDYFPSYDSLLLDSGAFSELNSGCAVDLPAYVEWAESLHWADAWAGLDDISGDWRRSVRNYKAGGFPTMHNTDPPELLEELVAMAAEGQGWIGVGLMPPRHRKERWLQETLDAIPDGLHVHGWAMRAYAHLDRFDSMDSTNWIRDAMYVRRDLPWLTYAEALEIVVKRYQRWSRTKATQDSIQLSITEPS